MAADIPATPVVTAAPVLSEPSPWQIRLRGLAVLPKDGGHVDGVKGSVLDDSNALEPELDITYYFTKNWAAEPILSIRPHHIHGAGALAGSAKIGEV